MNAKKVILILALIVVIILFFLAGLPSKLITTLTGSDPKPKETARVAGVSKPVVVAKKMPPLPDGMSPDKKSGQSTIVTKKVPPKPAGRSEKETTAGTDQKSASAVKKMPEPGKKPDQAPEKSPSAKSKTTAARVERAPASKPPVVTKTETGKAAPEKMAAAKTEPAKPGPAPPPPKASKAPEKPEPAAPAKTKVAKTKTPDSKPAAQPAKPVKTSPKTAPSDRQKAAAAKSKSPKAGQAPPPEVIEKYPYSIMLASCRLKKSAREVVALNQKKGLMPHIVRVKLKSKGEWWRVFEGQYKNRQAALKVKKKHNLKDSLVKKTPYTNQIGIFDTDKKAAAMAKRLKKLGYSPYVIKAEDNTLRLVTGAFVSRNGAKPQKDELAAKGIRSRIVER